jgi:hypothetical protein
MLSMAHSSIHQPINLSIHQFLSKIHQSTNLSIHQSTNLSIHQSTSIAIHQINPSIHQLLNIEIQTKLQNTKKLTHRGIVTPYPVYIQLNDKSNAIQRTLTTLLKQDVVNYQHF